MTPPVGPRLAARSPVDRRKRVRYLAAALCAGIGLLYVALLFLVADAEAGATENTYGAYLFLSVPYLVGAAVSVMADRQVLWIAGAAFQAIVIGVFAMFGAGLFGPGQGVLGYDVLAELQMGLWATVITGAQVALFGLLAYLALSRVQRHRSGGTA
jgi:hypothetical protein